MSRRNGRFSRNANPTVPDYTHIYSTFRVSNDTLKSAANCKDFIQRVNFIDDALMKERNANNRMVSIGKARLKSLILSKCRSEKMKCKRERLLPVQRSLELLDYDRQAQWCADNGMAFRPTADTLREWTERGFSLTQILELVYVQQNGVKAALNVSQGVWSGIHVLLDGVLLGDITLPENNNVNANVNANANVNENDNENENKNDDTDITMENCHIINNIQRRQNEHSSNHTKRARQGRQNPYFQHRLDVGKFRIYNVFPDSKNYLRFSGSLGRIVIYTNTPWWDYVCELFRLLMLHQHNCQILHNRIVSQGEITQKIFYRKLDEISMEQMRCGASDEFRMAITIGEYCEMIVAVPGGKHAFDLNQTLMANDAFSEDYQLGDKKEDYEGITRIPRFDGRIAELKEQGKWKNESKIFFLKKNMVKVKQKLDDMKIENDNGMEIEQNENDNDMKIENDKWTVLLSKLNQCKVHSWMHSLVASHFPGQEQAHKDAKLIQVNEDDNENVNLLQNKNLNNKAWLDYL